MLGGRYPEMSHPNALNRLLNMPAMKAKKGELEKAPTRASMIEQKMLLNMFLRSRGEPPFVGS
jgi:hypothetical protein